MKRRIQTPAESGHASRGRVARAVALVVAAGALSACSALSPQTTKLQYDPAEGVSATLGDVHVQDLLLVGQDGSGVLTGGVSNSGGEPVKVTVTVKGGSQQVSVPAGGSLNLSSTPTKVQISGQPGTTEQVQIETDKGAVATVTAPITTPTGDFATVTPAAEPTDTGATGS